MIRCDFNGVTQKRSKSFRFGAHYFTWYKWLAHDTTSSRDSACITTEVTPATTEKQFGRPDFYNAKTKQQQNTHISGKGGQGTGSACGARLSVGVGGSSKLP